MRSHMLWLTLLWFFFCTANAAGNSAKAPADTFDAALATQLKADANGMRHYILVILKTGPKDGAFKGQERNDIFAGHMNNIARLAEAGDLAVAGPFEKNARGYRGIFILAVESVAQAEALVQTDPAVRAGILIAEFTPWYGTAALMATPEIHKKITPTGTLTPK